jgi:hypothetical protein
MKIHYKDGEWTFESSGGEKIGVVRRVKIEQDFSQPEPEVTLELKRVDALELEFDLSDAPDIIEYEGGDHE